MFLFLPTYHTPRFSQKRKANLLDVKKLVAIIRPLPRVSLFHGFLLRNDYDPMFETRGLYTRMYTM